MDIVDRTESLVNISVKNKKYLAFKGSLFFIVFHKVYTAPVTVAVTC